MDTQQVEIMDYVARLMGRLQALLRAPQIVDYESDEGLAPSASLRRDLMALINTRPVMDADNVYKLTTWIMDAETVLERHSAPDEALVLFCLGYPSACNAHDRRRIKAYIRHKVK